MIAAVSKTWTISAHLLISLQGLFFQEIFVSVYFCVGFLRIMGGDNVCVQGPASGSSYQMRTSLPLDTFIRAAEEANDTPSVICHIDPPKAQIHFFSSLEMFRLTLNCYRLQLPSRDSKGISKLPLKSILFKVKLAVLGVVQRSRKYP